MVDDRIPAKAKCFRAKDIRLSFSGFRLQFGRAVKYVTYNNLKSTKMNDDIKAWKSYEEVAAYLLNDFVAEFGLKKFEGEQTIISNRSGTEWQIDAKGVAEDNETFVIVECRRSTTSRRWNFS